MPDKETPTVLTEKALEPLALGSIRPRGWLLDQLRIQAEGLSGHLDEFWPDIADSRWIGGHAEGWERAPYWLDGVVPLAFLLDDERLKAKVQRWLDYILEHQYADGWLGPVLDTTYGYEYDPWPVSILLKALTQFYEATGDPRVIPALKQFLQRLEVLLKEKPLRSWARMRWADLLLSVQWLYERCGDAWLIDIAQQIHEQGFDWCTHFEDFPFTEKASQWGHESHGPNCAMAIKQPAVWYRLSHNAGDRHAAEQIIQTLDTYHGQVTGVFTADEVVAGKNPSQGTELCAVVEYLFSLETLIAILGNMQFADRLERIAFNALPATMTTDMWAHQYDQQVNQVLCTVSEDHLFTTNGGDSNIFGLEPNFGCCTANMHQGWPKFVSHLWMSTPDNGLAAVAYAPCSITTQVANMPISLEVQTDYPFEETIRIIVATEQALSFPLKLRIPAWAEGATVTIAGQGSVQATPGANHIIERTWEASTLITLHFPMSIKTTTGYHGSVAVERGPLVYALHVGEEWKHIRGTLPHADWEVRPTTPWNYALEIDREHPEKSCTHEKRTISNHPFSSQEAPGRIYAQGRRVPVWTLEHNAAGPLPHSPITATEPLETLTLLPYGCTKLRVTEFPLVEPS